ncbi:DUF1761 domain-containing protein [Candidatus Woesearchaeota archaeon]|nr:DUF1761 domain-containing protein [Candidatus Woesearchaeota archaeon]
MGLFSIVDVNYWAVLVAALVAFVIGGLWYSPVLFGKLWMQLMGITPKMMTEAKKKSMTLSYVLQFIALLVMACVVAHFISLLGLTTLPEILQLVFWSWLGYQATLELSSTLWGCKSWSLFLLNSAHNLVSFVAMGLVFFWML